MIRRDAIYRIGSHLPRFSVIFATISSLLQLVFCDYTMVVIALQAIDIMCISRQLFITSNSSHIPYIMCYNLLYEFVSLAILASELE